jgi:metal-sulfur cluster biosynthetic enzyme
MFERDNGQDEVLRALDEILDPCLVAAGHRISIVDMGLITRVEITGEAIEVGVTFTEVGCQFTHRVIHRIETQIQALERFKKIRVVPEWLPGWSPDRMNESARTALSESQDRLQRLLSGKAVGAQ